jgi:tight adherence protein C
MTTLAMAAVTFVLVAGVTFAIGALLLRLLPALRAGRLAAASGAAIGDVSILRWEDRLPREWQVLVERIGRWLTPKDVGLLAGYRRRLIQAGFHNPSAVALFLGSKATVAIACGLSYLVYGTIIQRALPNLLPTSVILGGLGFFLPDVWLWLRRRQRQQDVTNALPDVLDLLMVCVEAGMGFDAAVARVAEHPGSKASPNSKPSPLHEELLRMHLEVRAGRPREEALRALGERLGLEEIRAVVGSFIQTDKLGTPLGKTLRVQAEASRVQRRHRAETRAQLVPLLMLGPTILFLMPSFMLVAMAPSLLRIFQIISTIGK